jgi:hypothetical protein
LACCCSRATESSKALRASGVPKSPFKGDIQTVSPSSKQAVFFNHAPQANTRAGAAAGRRERNNGKFTQTPAP